MAELCVVRLDNRKTRKVDHSDLRYWIALSDETVPVRRDMLRESPLRGDVPYLPISPKWAVRVEVQEEEAVGEPVRFRLARAFRGALQLLPGGREESRG